MVMYMIRSRMYNAYIFPDRKHTARYVAAIFRFRAHVPLNPRTLCEFEKVVPIPIFLYNTLRFFFFFFTIIPLLPIFLLILLFLSDLEFL